MVGQMNLFFRISNVHHVQTDHHLIRKSQCTKQQINAKIFFSPSKFPHLRAAIENVITSDEHRWKIVRNIVFDSHLSPVGRQTVIINSVSSDF